MDVDNNKRILVGIDEAGRGPVLGPMVVSCFCIEGKQEQLLKDLGVKDSKELMPTKRERIRKELEKLGKAFIIKISNEEINKRMKYMNLNTIEAYAIASLINKAYEYFKHYKQDIEVYIDLPSTNLDSFFNTLSSFLDDDVKKEINRRIRFVLEHKADSKYLVVGAASIIAKQERDKEMDNIKRRYKDYGDIGSGYPSDPLTISFLKQYYKKNKRFPPEVREKWMTLSNIKEDINRKAQRRLF